MEISREQQRSRSMRVYQQGLQTTGYSVNYPHNKHPQNKRRPYNWPDNAHAKISKEDHQKVINLVNEMESIGWAILCIHKSIQKRKEKLCQS